MYVIIWEYQVKTAHAAEFENIYSSTGAWAKLFQESTGFLGTKLLRDYSDNQHYLTIDHWASQQDYEAFRSQWKTDYEALDAQCEGLTEQETLLGKWEMIL
ncbi:MAG TPA: antibiotic biosynthesis monooxygenase [Anaerolineales bacterium]|nr:antibiotic biosynthesis monooxygenase [Anaerolineales bacterium]